MRLASALMAFSVEAEASGSEAASADPACGLDGDRRHMVGDGVVQLSGELFAFEQLRFGYGPGLGSVAETDGGAEGRREEAERRNWRR